MYGTTLRGLEARHHIDTEDFLAFVHDLPLGDFLTPNPVQRDVIASLPCRKLVFTNADSAHARRVLAALQLDDLFDSVLDIHTVSPYCKPMPESFAIAQELADEPDPRKCVMIDDLPRTTRAALDVGMASILYGTEEPTTEASGIFIDWKDLPILLA
jgi:putative hydrolase of the HAD superfamily